MTRDETWTCCEGGAEETVPTVQQVGERDGSLERERESERARERARDRKSEEPRKARARNRRGAQ